MEDSWIDGYVSSRLNLSEQQMKELAFETKIEEAVFYETPLPTLKNIFWTRRKYDFAKLNLIREGLREHDKVLDMGSGFGVGTYILSLFFDVTGIEVYKPLYDFCHTVWYELKFIYGDAEKTDLCGYDGYVAIDIFEHFDDPLGSLQKWRKEMNGVVVGRAPERGCTAGRRQQSIKYGIPFHKEFTRQELKEAIPDVKIYRNPAEMLSVFWFTMRCGE